MKQLQYQIFLSAILGLSLTMGAMADLTCYSQNFELLDRTNTSALDLDGWDLFVNVFDETGSNFVYNYGPFPAPNDISAPNISVISDVPSGGDPPVGDQGLVIFNDYNNGDHGNGTNRRIEVNVFQQQTIGLSDIGETYRFSFIAAPALDGSGENALAGTDSIAQAFIKTLDPSNNFQTTNFLTVDTDELTAGNTALNIDINLADPALDGQLLQFGFLNVADNFAPSSVNYDNVSFGLVPEPASLALVGLGGIAMLGRRRSR
jgi:hypothetical protein